MPGGVMDTRGGKPANPHGERSRPAHGRVHPAGGAAPLLAVALAACGGDPEVGWSQAEATVAEVADGGCTTSVVLGLSRQIADEVGCMAPDTLVTVAEGSGIEFSGSAVLPYLTPEARDDLVAAVAARGGTLQINSAYRTVAQQYLLYRWYQQGRCSISAAATPGRSNHESGRALDVGNYGDWIGALGDRGWSHDVPGDPVHFDHLASPDLRGMDVHAFQRLWNRNHPEDLIDEDGLYGPQTEARLRASPADGFAIGACPAEEPPEDPPDPQEPDDPPADGPDDLVDGDGHPDDLAGGCSAGGGSAGWLLTLLLLGVRPRIALRLRRSATGRSATGRSATTIRTTRGGRRRC